MRSVSLISDIGRQRVRVGTVDDPMGQKVIAIGVVAVLIAVPAVSAFVVYKAVGGGLVGKIAGGAFALAVLPFAWGAAAKI